MMQDNIDIFLEDSVKKIKDNGDVKDTDSRHHLECVYYLIKESKGEFYIYIGYTNDLYKTLDKFDNEFKYTNEYYQCYDICDWDTFVDISFESTLGIFVIDKWIKITEDQYESIKNGSFISLDDLYIDNIN